MKAAAYHFDRGLTFTAFALLGIGLVMVGSASISIAASKLDQPLFYFNRQLIFAIIGLLGLEAKSNTGAKLVLNPKPAKVAAVVCA